MAWTAVLSPLSWFRRPAKTDYEEVLADLAAEIEVTQTNLVQIRARTRRASLILPFWASLIWLIWTAGCYWLGLLTGEEAMGKDAWLVWWPIVATPILIFFARRIVKWWYRRVGAAEDKHLKELHRQRREKVEEIKRATRYDHLRKLLEKYDDEGKAAGRGQQTGKQTAQQKPAQQPAGQQQQSRPPQGSQAMPMTPGRGTMPPMAAGGQPPLPSGMRGAAPQQQFVRPPPPVAPVQRTWLDRVADAVLGADAASSTLGPEQKYALICSQCKRHNGLATRDEFDEIQYICPHCGSFESRRPSSTPISGSPFRQQRAIATPQMTQSKGGSSSLAAPQRRTNDLGDVSTDSPPPASPLAGGGHSDEEAEAEREVVEGKAGEEDLAEGEERSRGLSKRVTRSSSGQGMEVD